MNVIDRATILAFHNDRIQKFGSGTACALGWKTSESQSIRFDVLAEIGDLNDRSVLDVGCGHGDLRAHLEPFYPRLHYAGIDQMEAFLEVAVERYGDWPNTAFYLTDFSTAPLPKVDYVLASGAMVYRSREPDFVLRMITRLFVACRIGFGFNLLRWVEHPDGILAAHDPDAILTHCHILSSHVILHEGYLDDDFTVFLYRSASGVNGG